MFTRADLEDIKREHLTQRHMVGSYPGLYFTVYPQHAFRVHDSEEQIRITRAPRLAADNGIKFWCSAEWADDWSGREAYFAPYLYGAKFEPISEDEFNKIVQESSENLAAPLSLPLHKSKGFIGALLMYSTATDLIVSLVGEYEDEFIHYFWETTA